MSLDNGSTYQHKAPGSGVVVWGSSDQRLLALPHSYTWRGGSLKVDSRDNGKDFNVYTMCVYMHVCACVWKYKRRIP